MTDPLPVGTIQGTDIGASDARWHCTKLSEVEALVKAGYWAWRTYGWLADIP